MIEKDFIFKLESVSREYGVRKGMFSAARHFYALKNISLNIPASSCLGVVGESGCGKTTLAQILCGLLPATGGRVIFEGQPMEQEMRKKHFYRKVQMIFQNPYLSLDPKWRVEALVGEGLSFLPRRERAGRVRWAIEEVGLPAGYLDRKPEALSGGERQRVALARAVAVKPRFLILDEPTSQLDVSVQAQITALLRRLRRELQCGMLFISHDLALVVQLSDHLVVLREGEVVQRGSTKQVLRENPSEYTQRLIDAIPRWRNRS